jgi:hypothetical protein
MADDDDRSEDLLPAAAQFAPAQAASPRKSWTTPSVILSRAKAAGKIESHFGYEFHESGSTNAS